jgi:glutamyl-tRNA synthetase
MATHADDEDRVILDVAWSVLDVLNEWTESTIEAALIANLVNETGLSRRDAISPIRVAVTGSEVSPPLFEVMAALGRERTLARLRTA